MEDQIEILKEVYIHYLMLDSFSYHYEEIDIDTYWFMRTWPLRIQACLTDGKNMMADKNDIFSAKLEQEKDAFGRQLIAFYNKSFPDISKSTSQTLIRKITTKEMVSYFKIYLMNPTNIREVCRQSNIKT